MSIAETERSYQSTVVSPEMTLLIGRGPIVGAEFPSDAIAVAYNLGSIERPAGVWMGAAQLVPAFLAEDAGATRILVLISPSAVSRIDGRTLPVGPERQGWHMPSDMRAIALALRDCSLSGEAGLIYRAAKSIELIFETWRRLDEGALVPLVGGVLGEADSLRLMKARAIIDEQWPDKLSLDGIARACGLNREKLTRGFRDMFHCSVAEALSERRLQQASRMLLTTDKAISSIGYENGYQNNASFARAFGRRFGVSPTDFRAQRLAA